MTRGEHYTQSEKWANKVRQGDGETNDLIVALLRAQMHAAAATGTFMGDARTDAPEFE